MKPLTYFNVSGVMLLSLLVTGLFAQGVKIGDNPGIKDASSVLEMEKTNQGLLIPRVNLTGATDITTIPTPANSLLVYNLATAGTGGNTVTPGFYYWDNNAGRWKGLLTAAGPAGDVWVDGNDNILSVNAQNQSLAGFYNVALGNAAFGDLGSASSHVIAIGLGACGAETTSGSANVVALGMNAGYSNSAAYLTGIGHQAGYGNSGEHVIAVGQYAGYGNSGYSTNALGVYSAAANTGANVNALGASAAQNNQGMHLNALGQSAGNQNSGQHINAMGYESAYFNSANNVNVMGLSAGKSNTADNLNAFGDHAGAYNTGIEVNAFGPYAAANNSGWSVNLMGSQAGQSNTGSEVNALGAMAAQENTTAAVNAFGRMAAMYNSGYGTNAFGDQAAKFNNGAHVVAIGDQAVVGVDGVNEGEGNIGIGYHAADNVNTGQYNICIGHDTEIPNPSASEQINIGDNIIRYSNGVIELKNLIQLTPLSDPPASVSEGMIYYDSDDHKLKVYDGTTWQDCW
jgi:hypothetical protein